MTPKCSEPAVISLAPSRSAQLTVSEIFDPGSISLRVWNDRYRLRDDKGAPIDASIEQTWRRVADAVADAEVSEHRPLWSARFYEAMSELEFLPAGRILSGAGAHRSVTLLNCFVMRPPADSLEDVLLALEESALTLRQGGGVGVNFSDLRPQGTPVAGTGSIACGPVKAIATWDAMGAMLTGPGGRRPAMMGVLACNHPDIEDFIRAKSAHGHLTNFNLSVLVSDDFIKAVRADTQWNLEFSGKVHRTVRARDLWHQIMSAAFNFAEPGVIFIDRVNAANTLSYCETIVATNPCGEVPLPANGACVLGSINLARLVRNPFGPGVLDEERLSWLAGTAVRFLDNVIDVSRYPLPAQRSEALAKRRIGLGITGLADALAQCGLVYGSPAAATATKRWARRIERAARIMSARLAAEKGAFPAYDWSAVQLSPAIQRLDQDVRDLIRRNGLRNGQLLAIAPTGTISLLAGNVSSGIEPTFDLHYTRSIVEPTGSVREEHLEAYSLRLYRCKFGPDRALPEALVCAQKIDPTAHLVMQAAVQECVDGAISKTINCPESMSFEAFEALYMNAFGAGLKGCTAFRPNPALASVLKPAGVIEPSLCAGGACRD